jgi:hypothetical protein
MDIGSDRLYTEGSNKKELDDKRKKKGTKRNLLEQTS